MKSLFTKFWLAQTATVVLALLVAMAITRVALNRGFSEFLGRQESAVLERLAPALASVYEARGSWNFLRNRPENWERIMRQAAPQPGSRHGGGPGRNPSARPGHEVPPAWEPPEGLLVTGLRPMDRLHFRERLFLLDHQKHYLAGAKVGRPESGSLKPVTAGGQTVGWLGFVPLGRALPPDARRFLAGQVRIMTVSLIVGLVLAAVLAWWLARQLSRPVRELDATVSRLTAGHYDARAGVKTRDEIGRLAANVNQLAAALEKNRSARQRWMADIAHELRTPVAIIKGEVESLADGVRQPDERMVASLKEEVDQLASLIDDLQALALSDAGALNTDKTRVDLTELTGQAAEAYRQRMTERDIVLETHLENGVEMQADPQRLRQLLHNLLENSSRYVQPEGRVRLLLHRARDGVHLVVEDSGPGVPDEQIDKLFDRFYRGEGSRARATGGSGLGLSICKNIAEAHGGTISARRSRLGGLEIRVSLPA